MERNQSKPFGARAIGAVVTVLTVFGFAASAPAQGDEPISQQLATVSDRLIVAGLTDLNTLADSDPGKVLIVDLRTEGEGAPEEAASAEALGFGYANIPVSSAVVDPNQVDALRTTLAGVDPETLVVVHCVSGNRAGMLWGALALTEGESLESVKQSLDGVLTRQPAIDGLENFAQTLNAQH